MPGIRPGRMTSVFQSACAPSAVMSLIPAVSAARISASAPSCPRTWNCRAMPLLLRHMVRGASWVLGAAGSVTTSAPRTVPVKRCLPRWSTRPLPPRGLTSLACWATLGPQSRHASAALCGPSRISPLAPAPKATSRIEAPMPARRIPAKRPCAAPPLRLMPRMVGTPCAPPLCLASASSTARPHPSLSPPTKLAASASHSPLRRTSWSSPMTTMSAMAWPMMLAATRGGMANLASAGISWQAAKTHPEGSRPSKPTPPFLPRAPPPPCPVAGLRGRLSAPLP